MCRLPPSCSPGRAGRGNPRDRSRPWGAFWGSWPVVRTGAAFRVSGVTRTAAWIVCGCVGGARQNRDHADDGGHAGSGYRGGGGVQSAPALLSRCERACYAPCFRAGVTPVPGAHVNKSRIPAGSPLGSPVADRQQRTDRHHDEHEGQVRDRQVEQPHRERCLSRVLAVGGRGRRGGLRRADPCVQAVCLRQEPAARAGRPRSCRATPRTGPGPGWRPSCSCRRRSSSSPGPVNDRQHGNVDATVVVPSFMASAQKCGGVHRNITANSTIAGSRDRPADGRSTRPTREAPRHRR